GGGVHAQAERAGAGADERVPAPAAGGGDPVRVLRGQAARQAQHAPADGRGAGGRGGRRAHAGERGGGGAVDAVHGRGADREDRAGRHAGAGGGALAGGAARGGEGHGRGGGGAARGGGGVEREDGGRGARGVRSLRGHGRGPAVAGALGE